MWDTQAQEFSKSFRVLRYDNRGHGQSSAPKAPYSLEDVANDAALLLAHLGENSAHFCGLSLGGMVGMWLAATAPERIAGLGLCCTSAFLPPAAGWAARAAQVRSAGMSSVAEQVADRWFTPAFRASDPATVHAFRIALEGTGAEGYAGCCEAIGAMDLRPSLASICAPTLVISGAEDPATPPGHGAVIASGISAARLRVIRGAAHLANVSAAGEVTAALLPHLRSAAQLST